METFHMSMDEVLWGLDWRNITLLMRDKYRYVGSSDKIESKGNKTKSKKVVKEMTPDEEDEFFKSLI